MDLRIKHGFSRISFLFRLPMTNSSPGVARTILPDTILSMH